ncbi:uncharacterized protein RCC_07398 [Ramularia collo-cygni]|uniref:Uncharacterized protein n=1 Tax=Ramularia collo-cygni TaxID=112498 RepID=A0A2D3V4D0_9PEZI|nr:uncharacterized protein RCC_07398 [Ramularia collo-cygni]CZT21535.1 uncharacterized protein RCC_07398 [Ramularia collo-cygni]
MESKPLHGISQGLATINGVTKPLIGPHGRDEVAWRFIEGVLANTIPKLEYAEKCFVRGTLNPFFWSPYDKGYRDRRGDEGVAGFLFDASVFQLRERRLPLRPGEKYREWEAWKHLKSRHQESPSCASWRRMFISQPPVERISIHIPLESWDNDFDGERYSYSLPDGKPITMQDMVRDVPDEEEGSQNRHLFRMESVIDPLPVHDFYLMYTMEGSRGARNWALAKGFDWKGRNIELVDDEDDSDMIQRARTSAGDLQMAGEQDHNSTSDILGYEELIQARNRRFHATNYPGFRRSI